jgi:hypothetical protein
MDVIIFLYVSLGSSTVQLHDGLGSRCARACSEAGFSSQNGDHAWGVDYWRAAFYCPFFFGGEKNSIRWIFIKKCFLFTVESVCGVKGFTCGWQTFLWWRRGWNGGAEVAERFLCCGFRRGVKKMGQLYQCWWRICREINAIFSSFKYHMFYIHFWPIYWFSLMIAPTRNWFLVVQQDL